MAPIGVGIIGASPTGGWAALAHIPAVLALPELKLRAVATSRATSARQAAETWGVHGFDDPHELIDHPGVDLVVVAVKVPDHFALIQAALAAGKMVFSEWPLAMNLRQAEQLDEIATAAGIPTVIGLQGRFAPAVRHARNLISQGYLGRVLATNLVGSGTAWVPGAPAGHAYAFVARNGVTTLSVSVGHALDTVMSVLGDIHTVTSTLAVGRERVTLDDGRTIPVTSPDQIALTAGLDSGAVASMFYRGGRSRAGDLRWEINGTEGDLLLTSPLPNGNIQATELLLAGGHGAAATVKPIAVPDPDAVPGLVGPAATVAQVYRAFARDLAQGTKDAPSFGAAVALHRLLNQIEKG